jgi:hypothetical protein
MVQTRTYYRSFAGGQISPEMYSRLELPQNQTGLKTVVNMVTLPQGPARRRPGSQFAAEQKNSAQTAVLLPFKYGNDQSLVLEFGNTYIRFHTDGAPLSVSVYTDYRSAATVTFTSGTDVVNWAAHGLAAGEPFLFSNGGGAVVPTGLVFDTVYYVVNPAAGTFQIATTVGGTPINFTTDGSGTMTGKRRYSLGDVVSNAGTYHYCTAQNDSTALGSNPPWYAMTGTVFEIPSPYAQADLYDLHYVQSYDVMTITHVGYQTRELRRTGVNGWTLVAVTFEALLAAPGSVTATATFAEQYVISAIALGTGTLTLNGFAAAGAEMPFSNGDQVYVYGVLGTTDLPNGFYIVYNRTVTSVRLAPVSTGIVDLAYTNAYTANSGKMLFAEQSADTTNYYKVTAATSDLQESDPSSEASVLNILTSTGAYNTVSWAAVTGAERYYVYKKQSGLFGYIGQTETTSFVDDNIAPDMGRTPPIRDAGEFAAVDDYPGAVSYFEQRRCFAGTNNDAQTIWMTRSNTESDLSYSLPSQDTDRIKFDVVARENATIRHIVPLGELLLLTNESEWRVSAVNSDAITPSSVSVRPQSFVGASNVQPIVVNNSLLFCANRGGHMRELGFNWQSQGYVTGDLSIFANDLFDGYTIKQIAYQKAPVPILWAVRSDGVLLGLTYVPEQNIGGWHQHTFGDGVKSVCVIPEGDEDRVYVIAQRTINGSTKKFVERLGTFNFDNDEDAYFVDCGDQATTGGTVTTVTVAHLPSTTVSLLVDGEVQVNRAANGSGVVTLDEAVTIGKVISCGIPYEAYLVTLPMAIDTPRRDASGYGQGRPKNVNNVWLRVVRSAGWKVGPTSDKLVLGLPYATTSALASEETSVMTKPYWHTDGSIMVKQDKPLPLMVTGVTTEVEIGG